MRWGTDLRLGDWTLAGELVVQKESEEEDKTCVALGDALASSGDKMKVSETKECFVCLSSVMTYVHRIHAHIHAKGHKVGSGDGEGEGRSTGRAILVLLTCQPLPTLPHPHPPSCYRLLGSLH